MARRRLWFLRFLFGFAVIFVLSLAVSRAPLWRRLAFAGVGGAGFAVLGALIERRRHA